MLRETLNKRVFLKIFRNGTQGVPLRALDPGVEGLGIKQRSKTREPDPKTFTTVVVHFFGAWGNHQNIKRAHKKS